MRELNELKSVVEDGLKFLEKQKEVKETEVFASSNYLNVQRICYATNVPSNALEEPKSQENFGLSVRILFNDGKIGFGKMDSELNLAGVKAAFEKAKRNCVMDNDFKSLPSPQGKPVLSNYHDKAIMDLDELKAIDLAYSALNGAFNELDSKKLEQNLNITGELNFLAERMAIANSNGVKAADESTMALTTLTTILELEKDVAGMWFDSATSLKDFNPEQAGRESVLKAHALLNPVSIESGNYDVVLGGLAVAQILYSRLDVSLASIDFKISPYVNRLDETIAPDYLNIFDDGTMPGVIGSKAVTDEGLPTGKTSLVENGKLVNFLSNDYYCKKYSDDERFAAKNGFRFGGGGRNYDSEPGVHATNLVVAPGNMKDEELIKSIQNGIFIGRIWYCYPVNGGASPDFTATIRGDSYLIKNGEISSALTPNTCRINDSIDRCFKQLAGIGKTQKASLAWGEEAVVLTPEMAVKELRIERIAKGLY